MLWYLEHGLVDEILTSTYSRLETCRKFSTRCGWSSGAGGLESMALKKNLPVQWPNKTQQRIAKIVAG